MLKFVALVLFFCGASLFAQEVKLGLPVGHTFIVTSSVFSPKGDKVLTGSWDKTARLWDFKTGKLIRVFEGHSQGINSAVFSLDGSKVLTSSNDCTVRLWDISTGNVIHVFTGHKDKVLSASFIMNETRILTNSNDGTAKIWDVKKGNLILTFEGHMSAVLTAFCSNDNKLVVTGSKDRTIKIWESTTGNLVKTLVGHNDGVNSAVFSHDDKFIVSASDDFSVRVWDMKTWSTIHVLRGHSDASLFAEFSNDGSKILSFSKDNTVKLWDINTGIVLNQFKGHSNFVTSTLIDKNNTTLITASWDNTIRFWDINTGICLRQINVPNKEFNSLSLSLDSKYLVASSSDGTSSIWEMNSGSLIHELKSHTVWHNSAVVNHADSLFVTSSNDNLVRIWNNLNGKHVVSLVGHTSIVNSAIFSKNGKFVITASKDNTACIWDASSGVLFRRLSGHKSGVNTAVFNNDMSQVLTASDDGTCIIWDLYSGKLIQVFEGHGSEVNSAVFSLDEKYILTSSSDSIAIIWKIDGGVPIRFLKGHESVITSAIYSNDGRFIVTCSGDNTARLWNAMTGELKHIFRGHNSWVTSAVFNTDNSRIVTSSADQSLCVWEVESGKLIQRLNGHSFWVRSVTENLIGNSFLSASWDGSIVFWNSNSFDQKIRQFIFDSDPNKWVHIHPSGLFDASPEAMELMYWTKGLEVIEFAQLKDRYWLPGLWEKVMKGEALPEIRDMQELKLQPEVEVGEMKDNKIPVTLTKREGGYGKVSILINGKETQADARGNNFDKSKESQTIWVDLKDHPNLENGENTIAVKASSEDGFVVGRPVEKKVTMTMKINKPHFYAVVVGTGKYMNSAINLKYPEKDAESMSTALKLGAEQLFGKENAHIYTLTTASGDRPTKEKIKAVFAEIGKTATSTDIVLVYLSGHGVAWGGNEGDFYYLTADATAANAEAYNDDALRKNYTISTNEFTEYLKAIPANKQVMIIDACGSGKAVDNLLASRNVDVSQIKAIDRMKDRTGMFVISGSSADKVSYEASRYGQGLLTYSILQGMKGAALEQGKFFDVLTMFNFSRESVPKLAAGIGGVQTPQILVPKGGSFAIGQVDEESKKQIPLSSIKPVFVRTTFVDAESFSDDLNLSKLIDEELNLFASRGRDAQIVFLDSREFPDAYRLSGGYTQVAGKITMKLKIKGPKESEHTITANSLESLKEKIMEIVEGLE